MSWISRSLSLSCVLCATVAFAGWSKQGEGQASFKATGPAGFKIVGIAKNLEVQDDGSTLLVTVKLADLDTDNSLRNKHMLEDLEAAKFPVCTLTVPLAALKEGATDTVAQGTFSLHGKSKDLPFKYTAKCAQGVCEVEGSADLNLKDFEVKVRSYLGITVKPEVSVSAKFQVKK